MKVLDDFLVKIAESELGKGIKTEAEHEDTIDWVRDHPKVPKREAYKRIAKDHLKESKRYYKDLEVMEDFEEKAKTADIFDIFDDDDDPKPLSPRQRDAIIDAFIMQQMDPHARNLATMKPQSRFDLPELGSLNRALSKFAQVEPYQQESQWTCSAACLRAVLLHHGEDWPENVLVPLIGAKPKRGAECDEIAEAARLIGLMAFEYSFESLDQARVLLDQGLPIICDIQSFKHPGKGHYVVMTAIDEGGVHLMDPNAPEESNSRVISPEEMDGRWWDHAMAPPHELMSKWGIIVVPTEGEEKLAGNAASFLPRGPSASDLAQWSASQRLGKKKGKK